MGDLSTSSTDTADGDWLRCPVTRRALGGFVAALESAITAEDAQLRVMALHVIRRGGKRLRPSLLLLSGTFGRFDPERLLPAAAALELMHVASLYHDDIMDRAPLRRDGATTSARWGNPVATFAGTYLFARACDLWSSLGRGADGLASRGAVELATGQLNEVENAFDPDLDEATHLSILSRKTATLFELPCRLGSLLSESPSAHAEALSKYGRALGVAFQLADDALDLRGAAEDLGKAAGNDLREGVYTLAVLRTLRKPGVGDRLRDLLEQSTLRNADIKEAIRLVAGNGAVDDALDVAREYARRALEALGPLPEGPALESLYLLADYAIRRSS
jgi:heptaprenyl diphosphate synthase